MASTPLFDIFRIKDLRDRIFFTLSILLVFRLGAVLPIPGINGTALKLYFTQQQSNGTSLTDYFDFFSGGAFHNFSIFMLGIMPYISMSIIMQLMVVVFPSFKRISQEDGGKKKIHRWTRLGTVIVCLIQSFAVTELARSIPDAVSIPHWSFVLIAMLTVTTGTMFLMWMGEQINQRGIGNGISLLIFAGIVARIPDAFYQLFGAIQRGDLNPVFVILVLLLFIGVIALVIFEQQGQRAKSPSITPSGSSAGRCTGLRVPTSPSR
jgi:preprotein translocase subunit SecY